MWAYLVFAPRPDLNSYRVIAEAGKILLQVGTTEAKNAARCNGLIGMILTSVNTSAHRFHACRP